MTPPVCNPSKCIWALQNAWSLLFHLRTDAEEAGNAAAAQILRRAGDHIRAQEDEYWTTWRTQHGFDKRGA